MAKKAVKKQQIVEAARKWLGTRYQNQGRDNYGLDCGGLILVVGRELGISSLEFLGYSNNPDGETFERLLCQELNEVTPKEKVQIGDIIACDYGDGIQHTAFVTDKDPKLKIIHAKRAHGVVEQFIHGRDLRAWVKTYRVKGVK
jgi:cell wall-associated NlpC family hydrolase